MDLSSELGKLLKEMGIVEEDSIVEEDDYETSFAVPELALEDEEEE